MASVGFRPHTYWTPAVVLAGLATAPRLIARRRIVFATGRERMAYHQAAEIGPDGAEAWIESVRTATQRNAAKEIGALLAELRRDGMTVEVAVVPEARPKLPATVAEVVRVHALMHAAEGVFYRDVVAAACREVGLDVVRTLERDLPEAAAAMLDVEPARLTARLTDLATGMGPPWNEDYRLAALAAWLGLAGTDH